PVLQQRRRVPHLLEQGTLPKARAEAGSRDPNPCRRERSALHGIPNGSRPFRSIARIVESDSEVGDGLLFTPVELLEKLAALTRTRGSRDLPPRPGSRPPHPDKADISTLGRSGHLYFALTE